MPAARLILAGTLLSYAGSALVAADLIARHATRMNQIRVVGAFVAMHVGYGSGLWGGLLALIASPIRPPRHRARPV